MNQINSDVKSAIARLLEPGILGNYDYFEVIEIFVTKDTKRYFNIFSIYVAQEDTPVDLHRDPEYLSKNIRCIQGIPGYKFTVAKRYITKFHLLEAASLFDKEKIFVTHSRPISHGKLNATQPVFYAPDGSDRVPLNRLLKNNFWNGSYVIELANAEKTELNFITSNVRYITALGSWVKQFIAIDIASTPDRLGNIIVQIPVTSLVVDFCRMEGLSIGIDVAWKFPTNIRRINGSIKLGFDKSIIAYGEKELVEGKNPIVKDSTNRPLQGMVWDIENELILAAYPSTIYWGIPGQGRVHVSTMRSGKYKRTFSESNEPGADTIEIDLLSRDSAWDEKIESCRPNGDWTERRISDNEIQELVQRKEFMQYGGLIRSIEEHRKAMADIRWLINVHGQHSICIWDPYLSSSALFKTIFHCKYADSQLRALTSSKIVKKNDEPVTCQQGASDNTNLKTWIESESSKISNALQELSSIKLEYRISFGPDGWNFHDRFLIFPKANGGQPMVWSLGGSVNRIGHEHTIVQLVANPQPVLDAFEDLWSKLDAPKYQIWKSEA